MEIPERVKQDGLVEYADSLSKLYSRNNDAQNRKKKGQFFTPSQVSTYMCNLFEINQDTISLLDPGAGTGVLTAAFCARILDYNKTVSLTIDAYENDTNLLPLLEKTLESCKLELGKKGHNVGYNIYDRDFILQNERYLRTPDLFSANEGGIFYDFVVSNPPYYKLNKDSHKYTATRELISGQPNIYALFMATAIRMLKPRGEGVFITPRSFCSGLYYRKFREWLINNVQITNIHLFESRKDIFARDGVLQENVITKIKRQKENNKCNKLAITTSKGKDFGKIRGIEVQSQDIIVYRNGETFIRIPASPIDIDTLHIVDAWPSTLKDLGLEISTGPVVPFRTKKYLLPELIEHPKSVPLLWMHNMRDMNVTWPLKKNKKASAIHVCNETMTLLLPVKNYVLVKRFSSKEQNHRLFATVLLKSEFPHRDVGIENHVNYIYRPHGNLSVHEALGIATILNTTIMDKFFRVLNGSTQVNATDIRSIPFPTIENVRRIGETVYKSKHRSKRFELDSIVTKILGIATRTNKNTEKSRSNDE